MTEHYDAALAVALERGLARQVAEDKALLSLGSPRRAWFAFRRKHLTKRESSLVDKIRNKDLRRRPPYILLAYGLGWFILLLGVPIVYSVVQRDFTLERWSNIAGTFVIITIVAASIYAGWKLYQRANTTNRLLIRGYGFITGGILFAPMQWRGFHYEGPLSFDLFSALILTGASAYVVGLGIFALHVSRKLQRIGNDNPPSAKA